MAEVVTAMPLQDRPAELADLPEAAIREYLDLAWVRYIDPSRRRPYGRQRPRNDRQTESRELVGPPPGTSPSNRSSEERNPEHCSPPPRRNREHCFPLRSGDRPLTGSAPREIALRERFQRG